MQMSAICESSYSINKKLQNFSSFIILPCHTHTCRLVDVTSMNEECEAVIVVDASTLSGRRVRSVQWIDDHSMDTSALGHQLLVMYNPCDGGASPSHVPLWSPRLALLHCVGKHCIWIAPLRLLPSICGSPEGFYVVLNDVFEAQFWSTCRSDTMCQLAEQELFR